MQKEIGDMQKITLKVCGFMMQQKIAKDFVLATGEAHSVREFIEIAFAEINEKILWRGKGDSEVGYSSTR